MPTCAQVVAQTLSDLGVERAFGLPGGEILDLVDAAISIAGAGDVFGPRWAVAS